MKISSLISQIFENAKKVRLFCFDVRAKQPEVDMPGPRRDRCVSEFVLHGTVLLKNFSVIDTRLVSWAGAANICHGFKNELRNVKEVLSNIEQEPNPCTGLVLRSTYLIAAKYIAQ